MISRFLLGAYFLLLPFKTWPNFSSLISRATLADYLFITFGLLALGKLKNLFDLKWWTTLDWLAIVWLFVEVLSMVAGGAPIAALSEFTATLYLLCLYFSVRLLVEPQHVLGIVKAMIASGFISGVLAIGGWLIAMATQEESIFVLSIKSYPYLGNIYRAQALTGSPNMLVSFLMLGILFSWARFLLVPGHRLINLAGLGLMLVALFLTFSRDVLIVLACMIIIHFLSLPATSQANQNTRLMTILTVFLMIAAYIFLSHFVVTSNNGTAIHELVSGEYIKGEKPLFMFGEPNNGYAIYPSIYLELKEMAFRAFLDSGGVGVGGGNFNQYLSVLKSEGLYPEKFTAWDPHSTYFGVLAEHGLIGLMTVWGILTFLCRKSLLRIQSLANRDFVSIGFAGVFLGVAIEAVCVDIMNFRQYWVLFALAATLFSKPTVTPVLLDRKLPPG
jgi:hypothetical protein